MGQNRIYVNISKQILLGAEYDKGFTFQIHFLCFTLGIGLTNDARGFGFWFK